MHQLKNNELNDVPIEAVDKVSNGIATGATDTGFGDNITTTYLKIEDGEIDESESVINLKEENQSWFFNLLSQI